MPRAAARGPARLPERLGLSASRAGRQRCCRSEPSALSRCNEVASCEPALVGLFCSISRQQRAQRTPTTRRIGAAAGTNTRTRASRRRWRATRHPADSSSSQNRSGLRVLCSAQLFAFRSISRSARGEISIFTIGAGLRDGFEELPALASGRSTAGSRAQRCVLHGTRSRLIASRAFE